MKLVGLLLGTALGLSFDQLTLGDIRRIDHNERYAFKNNLFPAPQFNFQIFGQPLDHFSSDASNTSDWNQLYFVNDRYYSSAGPVFLELTGEWALSTDGIDYSLANDLARLFNGTHIGLEHRYYGENTTIVPDFSVENLEWLNAYQALADAANFIQNNTLGLPAGTKWIVIGGSYAGNLAAWMRLTYPDLVFASHSSSAPVNAKTDFWRYGYATDVGLARIGGQKCADGWVKAVAAMDNLIVSTNSSYVLSRFGLSLDQDIRDVATISTIFSRSVQYGARYSYVNITGAKVTYVDAICSGKYFSSFTDSAATDEELLNSLIKVYNLLDENNTPENRTITDSNRLWTWQYCKQYGYFQVKSHLSRSMFSRLDDIEYQTVFCVGMFGTDNGIPDTESVNTKYGGLDILNRVDRVLYVNGDIDQWHWLGINEEGLAEDGLSSMVNNGNEILFIKGGRHCSDLSTPSSSSSNESKMTYRDILEIWSKWLA